MNIKYTFSVCTPSKGQGRLTNAPSLLLNAAHSFNFKQEASVFRLAEQEGSEAILYQYQEFSEERYSSEAGTATLFGIAVYRFSDGAKKELLKIHNISADKFKVDMIADLCTVEQLEPVHIYDVLDDNLL